MKVRRRPTQRRRRRRQRLLLHLLLLAVLLNKTTDFIPAVNVFFFSIRLHTRPNTPPFTYTSTSPFTQKPQNFSLLL